MKGASFPLFHQLSAREAPIHRNGIKDIAPISHFTHAVFSNPKAALFLNLDLTAALLYCTMLLS